MEIDPSFQTQEIQSRFLQFFIGGKQQVTSQKGIEEKGDQGKI